MLNFNLQIPTEYVFGTNTEKEVGKLIKKYNGHSCLIVYGGGSIVKNGLLSKITTELEKSQITYTLLGGVKANPESDFVYQGIQIIKEKKLDFILAIGGGSVIDTAKAIGAGAIYDGDFWDFFRNINRKTVEKTLPVGVILTIAAAGSEGSPSMVITNSKTKEKRGNNKTDVVRPVFAIMNPELTYSVSSYQTACGIVDIMTHTFERYFSNTEDCLITDSMCEALLKVLLAIGPEAIKDPHNYKARSNIMWASTIAHNNILGMDRKQDWASHKIEHELSGKYNIAHGAGLAVIVPRWMRYVSTKNPHKFQQFATNIMGEEDISTAITKLSNYWTSLGMPHTLEEVGYQSKDLDYLVEHVDYTNNEYVGNYIKLTREDVRNIYLQD